MALVMGMAVVAVAPASPLTLALGEMALLEAVAVVAVVLL